MAIKEPAWTDILNKRLKFLSSRFISCSKKTKIPLEEMGSHSVIPWIIAKAINGK